MLAWSSAPKNPTGKTTGPAARRSAMLTSSGRSAKPRCSSSRATSPRRIPRSTCPKAQKGKSALDPGPQARAEQPISCSKTRWLSIWKILEPLNSWRRRISLRPNWNHTGMEHAFALIREGLDHPCTHGSAGKRMCPIDTRQPVAFDWRSVLLLHTCSLLVRFCPLPEPAPNWGARYPAF